MSNRSSHDSRLGRSKRTRMGKSTQRGFRSPLARRAAPGLCPRGRWVALVIQLRLVNTATPAPLDDATIIRTLQASKAEAAAGRMPESDQLLAGVAQRAPNHPAVLNELGVRMLGRGAPDKAQALFARATSADPKHPALWSNLASSLKALGRRAEEMDAIEKALELEPRHLSALLQKGAYLEETGDPRNAARAYQNALDCVPPGAELPANIKEAFAHAKSLVDADTAALTSLLEEPLAAIRERHGGRRERRVEKCLETVMGRRRVYHSQPTWMYFPELPEIEFFDRSEFPWLEALEAASGEIRTELMRVLVADRDGLQPYIDFPKSMPLDQFRELNRSRRWSAYFLWNQSQAIAGHIARCPITARSLESLAALSSGWPGADGFFLDPRCEYAHPRAHRSHQYALHRTSTAGDTAGLRVSSGSNHARMGTRSSVGLRRHHRT